LISSRVTRRRRLPSYRKVARRVDEALAIRIIHDDQFAPVTTIHDDPFTDHFTSMSGPPKGSRFKGD
jgi:hypothetical protein